MRSNFLVALMRTHSATHRCKQHTRCVLVLKRAALQRWGGGNGHTVYALLGSRSSPASVLQADMPVRRLLRLRSRTGGGQGGPFLSSFPFVYSHSQKQQRNRIKASC